MAPLHVLIAVAFATVTAAQLPAAAPAQDVPVTVTVVDAGNLPVTDLTTADFEAFVDASAVPVTSVSRRGPLSLAVVVDTSRSTTWGRAGTIVTPEAEVLAALSSLRDDDWLRFGSFGPRVRFAGPWRRRGGRNLRNEVERAFKADADETHGPSPIWDVIYDTVDMLAAQPPPRAILLLTDGRSTGNSRSINMVADFAAIHGVAIHSIVRYFEMHILQGEGKAVAIRPWVALETLATFSGGTAVGFALHEQLRGMVLSEQLGLGATRQLFGQGCTSDGRFAASAGYSRETTQREDFCTGGHLFREGALTPASLDSYRASAPSRIDPGRTPTGNAARSSINGQRTSGHSNARNRTIRGNSVRLWDVDVARGTPGRRCTGALKR